MARRISVCLDRELDRAIKHFASDNKLTQSQAIRELLRQSLTDANDVTRGWLEGFSKGYSDVQREQQKGIAKLKVG